TRTLEFEAPPRPPEPPRMAQMQLEGAERGGVDLEKKPLPPLATFIGAGVTAVLAGAAIASGIDANAGVKPFEDAAKKFNMDCVDQGGTGTEPQCKTERAAAEQKLSDGQSKETRTNVLWIATGGAAVATG